MKMQEIISEKMKMKYVISNFIKLIENIYVN